MFKYMYSAPRKTRGRYSAGLSIRMPCCCRLCILLYRYVYVCILPLTGHWDRPAATSKGGVYVTVCLPCDFGTAAALF